MSEQPELSKEQRILRAVKLVLTRIIKETAVPPGTIHPLSEGAIEDLRQCLSLIAARETELSVAAGRPKTERPFFIDEPRRRDKVVIPLSQTDLGKKKNRHDE